MKKKVMKEGKKREECIIGAARKSSEHNAYSATQVSVPLIFAHIVDLYTFSLQFASMIWIENACDAQMHLRLQMHQPEELSRVEQLMKTTSWIKQNNNNNKNNNREEKLERKKGSKLQRLEVIGRNRDRMINHNKTLTKHQKYNASCAQNDLYF